LIEFDPNITSYEALLNEVRRCQQCVGVGNVDVELCFLTCKVFFWNCGTFSYFFPCFVLVMHSPKSPANNGSVVPNALPLHQQGHTTISISLVLYFQRATPDSPELYCSPSKVSCPRLRQGLHRCGTRHSVFPGRRVSPRFSEKAHDDSYEWT
jgi:hypothetical protein